MANLFVIYIPIEDVSDEANNNVPESEMIEVPAPELPAPEPAVPPAVRFRAVASSSDLGRLTNAKETQVARIMQQLTDASCYDYAENQSESKPLLDSAAEDNRSSNNMPKSASSNILMNQVTDQGVGLGTGEGTLAKSMFREVPGSRFKISAAVNIDDGKGSVVAEQARTNRRASLAPDNTVATVEDDITKEEITLKEFLEDKLSKYLNISNHVWQKNIDKSLWMVSFMVSHDQCDKVFNSLTCSGFGRIPGTSLSIFPTSVHKQGQIEKEEDALLKSNNEKSEFLKSIKSSLTVAQVVGAISSGASLTFDYLLLILLASMIAGLGLAESSSVVLVASMLISPLMGPIIGFTFGIVIRNKELCKLGVRTELIGLTICMCYGFLFGLITGLSDNAGARWSSDGVWPTSEMQARGMLRSLWVGILIALPSGAGVALAILGGNTGSLVGVAISASLLPPLVNAGMLWGLSLVTAINSPPRLNGTTAIDVHPNCAPLVGNNYKFVYSCEMSSEAAILGSVSLLLAILNIICIFLMGTIVMKIKELSPLPGATKGTVSFWKKDVATMRHTYETIKGSKSLDMGRMAKDLIAAIQEKDPAMNLDNVINDIKNDPSYNEIMEHLPTKPQNLLQEISLENRERTELRHRAYQRSTEVVCGDQVYHTISGNIAQFRNAISGATGEKNNSCRGTDILALRSPSENLSADTSQSEGLHVVSSSGSGSHTGGCVLRMRKQHHNQHRAKSVAVRSDRAAETPENTDEDEVLMINYEKLNKIHHYQKRRSTSIGGVGLHHKPPADHRSPSRSYQSPGKSPMKSSDVRIHFCDDDVTIV